MIGLVNIVYREGGHDVCVFVGMETVCVVCMFVLHFCAILPLSSFCPPHFWFIAMDWLHT